MNIKSVQVLVELNGADQISLYLEAETPFPNMGYDATANVTAQKGFGLEWAKKTFPGIPMEVINTKTGERTLIP